MNYDITMCSGEGCTKRNTCHRYIAYLNVPTGELRFCAYQDPKDCINDKHKLYWEEKQ